MLAVTRRSGPIGLFGLEPIILGHFLLHLFNAAKSTVGIYNVQAYYWADRIEAFGRQVRRQSTLPVTFVLERFRKRQLRSHRIGTQRNGLTGKFQGLVQLGV